LTASSEWACSELFADTADIPENYSQRGWPWPRKPLVSATIERKITARKVAVLLAVTGCFLSLY
jgi:hypothetical protein